MNTAAKKAASKRKVRTKPPKKLKALEPVYFVVEKVALLSPGRRGEEIGALVPLTRRDVDIMRGRRYHVGQELRAMVTNSRNYKFLKLAHGIGQLMIQSVDEFARFGDDAHAAFKELQVRTGVECDVVKYELADGTEFFRTEARSIAFDDMDEGRFSKLVAAVWQLIQSDFWPMLSEDACANLLEMMEKQR